MRKVFVAVAVAGLMAAIGTAAMGAEAPKADYATPKATVKTLYRALVTGDMATAKSCWYVANAEAGDNLEHNLMPVMGPLMIRRAAAEKLGADKVTKLPDPSGALDGVMKSIDSTTATEMGDSAAVEIKEEDPAAGATSRPAAPAKPKVILLKRVGGEWKITSHPYAGTDAPPAAFKAVVAAQTKMFNDLVTDITAGKFKNEDEIIAEWHKRAAEVAKLAPAAGTH